MKKYFEQLRPLERRLAVGVLVILFLVLNAVFIYPHFSDWGKLQRRLDAAQKKLKLYQTGIALKPTYEAQIKTLQSQGESIAAEDMSVNMLAHDPKPGHPKSRRHRQHLQAAHPDE